MRLQGFNLQSIPFYMGSCLFAAGVLLLDPGTLDALVHLMISDPSVTPDAFLEVEGSYRFLSALTLLVCGAVFLSTGRPARGFAMLLFPFWIYNVLLRPINGPSPNRFVRVLTLVAAFVTAGCARWLWTRPDAASEQILGLLEPISEQVSAADAERFLTTYIPVIALSAFALAWGILNAVVFSLLLSRRRPAEGTAPSRASSPVSGRRRGRLATYFASKSARRHEKVWQNSLAQLDCSEHGLWEFTADDGGVGRTRSYIGCRNMVILEMSRTPLAFRITLTTRFANGDTVRTLEASDRRKVHFSNDEFFSMARRGLTPKEVLSCHLESVAEVAEANACGVLEIEPHEVKVNLTHGGLTGPKQQYQGGGVSSCASTYSIETA